LLAIVRTIDAAIRIIVASRRRVLTLNVEQDAGVHRRRQRDMTRDAGDRGIMVSSQDLEVSPAAPARRGWQDGEIVRRLFRSVQSGLRQGHAPSQNGRRVSTLGRALEGEFRAFLHRYKLVSGIQPAPVYQQVRSARCLCNERSSDSIIDLSFRDYYRGVPSIGSQRRFLRYDTRLMNGSASVVESEKILFVEEKEQVFPAIGGETLFNFPRIHVQSASTIIDFLRSRKKRFRIELVC